MATIKDNWDGNRGDMMYGIGEQINIYLEHVYSLTGSKGSVRNQAHSLKETKYAAINTYNVALSNDKFNTNHGTIAVTPPTSTKQVTQKYLAALNAHKKYAPSTTSGNVGATPKLLTALQKGNDSIAADSSAKGLKAAAKELAIRRSCKFGIEYNVEKGARIHYILDGMDMKKVSEKAKFDKVIHLYGGDLVFKKISICTSELRYLFRNWQKIKSTGHVLFYWNYTSVKPPWEDAYWASSLDGWATYAAHRVEKALALLTKQEQAATPDLGGIYLLQHLKKLKVQFEPFLTARKTGQPALTQIDLFHKIPSDMVNT